MIDTFQHVRLSTIVPSVDVLVPVSMTMNTRTKSANSRYMNTTKCNETVAVKMFSSEFLVLMEITTNSAVVAVT